LAAAPLAAVVLAPAAAPVVEVAVAVVDARAAVVAADVAVVAAALVPELLLLLSLPHAAATRASTPRAAHFLSDGVTRFPLCSTERRPPGARLVV
jgi:hypothetical protein